MKQKNDKDTPEQCCRFELMDRYPEFEYSKERKEKGKNTLKACVPLLLDISQSDSMASRAAVILIG